jgi:ribosome-binding protein 1
LRAAKEVTSNESDASESSEATFSEPSTPPETLYLRKNASKAQQLGKKGKGKSGILVNRNEPTLVKEVLVEEEVNHFEEIKPKDAVEILRAAPKEENEKKHFRDHKKSKQVKPESPPPAAPVSPPAPKAQPIKEVKVAPVKEVKVAPVKEVKVVEEKVVRKKRSEQSSGNRSMVSEEAGITNLIREMSRTELTKNQIQVLIDFLLNKQSDTITADPTEWSEGKSDMVQKLKKQLQEKEAQLKNEQDALTGTQMKLKELRSEYNNDKVQFNASLKAYTDQLQSNKMEIKNLQSELHFMSEKHIAEKQSLSHTFKQLQSQYMQMKETLDVQESMPSIQQLQNDNQILQQEIIKKNQQVMELTAFVEESRLKDVSRRQVNDRDVLLKPSGSLFAGKVPDTCGRK